MSFRLINWGFLILASAAYAEPLPCDNPLILVDSEYPVLHKRVCAAVSVALPKLEACYLKQNRPIEFGFGDEISQAGISCLGLYHRGEDRIDLLTPEGFGQAHLQSEFCDSMTMDEHYDSIVVHELTHALLDQSPWQSVARRVDHEYIAYAMQIENMIEPSRGLFIANIGLNGPIEVGYLNEFTLDISPSMFAATAWLHFSSPGNGCEFVGQIVRGEYTLWQQPF